ncbi:MAG: hypothetical protein RL701_4064 [Pseudomonadota bacterium]|jgi:hypothetical protein
MRVAIPKLSSKSCAILAAISCSVLVHCRPDGAAPGPASASTATTVSTHKIVVFRGTCDASGTASLAGSRFAVADDEDNLLRVYDSALGGDALFTIDISPALALPAGRKAPEADIEAATRLGDRALWLTSHGLSSKGERQPARFRFFATTAPSSQQDGAQLAPIGTAYQGLLQDLLDTPALAQLGLLEASARPPKAGGLNIEGMARRSDDHSVLIGFRSPRPGQRALLVPLLNPEELVAAHETSTVHAQFGAPILLDLDGLGIRSLTLWRGQYVIAAGALNDEATSQLYLWNGSDAPQRVRNVNLEGLNPEAIVASDDSDKLLLVSDDGARAIDGVPCKKLKDRSRKQFRGVWLQVSDTRPPRAL